jgi:hypothetical protein
LGDALAKAPPAPGAPNAESDFAFQTGAYLNQLNIIGDQGQLCIRSQRRRASPNGPIRFDVNTQSLRSVIDRVNARDAGQTINMHLA